MTSKRHNGFINRQMTYKNEKNIKMWYFTTMDFKSVSGTNIANWNAYYQELFQDNKDFILANNTKK